MHAVEIGNAARAFGDVCAVEVMTLDVTEVAPVARAILTAS